MTPAELDELQANIAEFMDTHPAYHYPHLLNEAADALSTLRADLAAKERALRKAEITIRQRQHPANEPRDPPNVLVTLGFWPDCGCGECYAIHCLGEVMADAAALRAQLAQATEAVETLNAGRPLGDIVGLQTARNAITEAAALRALLKRVSDDMAIDWSDEASAKLLNEIDVLFAADTARALGEP